MNRKFLLIALIALLDLPLSAAPPPSVTFAPLVKFPLGSRVPVSLALGDFEGDGMRDIAVAFSNGTQTILRNRTIGIAGPRTSSIDVSPLISPAGGGDVVFGDLNKDGADDWITTVPGTNRLTITAGGSSTASSSPTVPQLPHEIRLADLDGDGNLDIIVGYDQTSGACSILRGRGDASVSNATAMFVGGGPALTVVDWNGDGALDIVAGSGGPPRVNVAFNTGALTFAAPQVVASLPGTSGAFVEGIAVRNRSAIESAAMAISVRDNATGQRTLYLLQADDPSGAVPIATSNGSIHATFADLNRDGRTDLVIVDSEARKLVVRAGSADGSLPVIAQVDLPPVDVTAAVVGDVSGDGVSDVVIGSADGAISVYVNTTAPTRHRAARH